MRAMGDERFTAACLNQDNDLVETMDMQVVRNVTVPFAWLLPPPRMKVISGKLLHIALYYYSSISSGHSRVISSTHM
jgi:hypothetical protein